jgi:cellulose synthase/poly-beta-1,6-N-acetylglucosamine synthase-like glycosyltransferase
MTAAKYGRRSTTVQMTVVPGRVSVIIPSHSHVAHLPAAIRSALDQDYADLDVIVVDDGSVADVPAALVAAGLYERVTYIRQPASGAAAARNRGRTAADGEYLAFLDEDDRWAPTKISQQVTALERHRDVGAVFADGTVISHDDQPLWRFQARKGFAPQGNGERIFDARALTLCDLLKGIVVTSSTLVRAQVFDALSGFLALPAGQDIDFFFRLHARYGLAYLPEPLFFYRLTPSSISRSGAITLRHTLHVLDHLGTYPLRGAERTALRTERGHVERTLAELAFDAGDHRAVRSHLLKATAAQRTVHGRTLLLFGASMLPHRMVPALKAMTRRAAHRGGTA